MTDNTMDKIKMTDNTMDKIKMTKQQTVIYTTLHKKTPKIKQKLKTRGEIRCSSCSASGTRHATFFLNVVLWKFIKSFVSIMITFVE